MGSAVMAERFKVGQAPWELPEEPKQAQGAAASFKVGEAPWEKGESDVIDEAHPDISFTSRLIYKNLGTDQQSGLEYLKRENPTLQFDIRDNEIVAKKPQESKWRRLDPSGFDLEDVTDIGYDIPAAILETGASALGGIGGGLAGTAVAPGIGTGIGALGGASAAGAGTAGGLEAIRQGLGRTFGIKGSSDPEAIKYASMFGAASPLLFGTGAGVKQVGKYAAKKGLGQEATERLLRAQSGIPVKAKRSIAPKIGEKLSGISSDTLDYASKNLDEIKKAEDITEGAAVFQDLTEDLQSASLAKRQTIGSELGGAIDEIATEGLDIDDVREPLEDLISEYADKAARKQTKKARDDLDFIKTAFAEYMPDSTVKTLDGESATSLLRDLNELTQISRIPDTGKTKFFARKSDAEKALHRAASKAIKNLDSKIDAISGGRVKDLKSQYRKAVEVDQTLSRYFKDPEKTEATLRQLQSPRGKRSTKKVIKQIENYLGIPVYEQAQRSGVQELFARPAQDALSLGGTTSTSRTIGSSALGAALGYGIAQETGAVNPFYGTVIGGALGSRFGSPAAMRRWMELNRLGGQVSKGAQQLGPATLPATPQTFINTWQQLEQNNRR